MIREIIIVCCLIGYCVDVLWLIHFTSTTIEAVRNGFLGLFNLLVVMALMRSGDI